MMMEPCLFHLNIIYNNNIPREEFGEDFFNLIGDVLVDIIQDQEEIKYVDNDWENNLNSTRK